MWPRDVCLELVIAFNVVVIVSIKLPAQNGTGHQPSEEVEEPSSRKRYKSENFGDVSVYFSSQSYPLFWYTEVLVYLSTYKNT